MYGILFLGVLILYLLGACAFVISAMNKNSFISEAALCFTIFGFLCHSACLIIRAVVSGFPPMSNLYESMFLFSWAVVLMFLFVMFRYKLKIMGAFIMPPAFLLVGFASLLDCAIEPLVPVLQSYWLFIHVGTCFLSYACFACASILGIMYLLQERQMKSKHFGKIFARLPALDALDKINYHTILAGFVFLTLGIITGSIWAERAWGSWWSWDAKETWAFITWLIYAAYLHARHNSGWGGKKAAVLSILGFIAVLFTYLGVSFLLPGLHSYL